MKYHRPLYPRLWPFACGFLVVAASCSGSESSERGSDATDRSGEARVFVQTFYSWYVPSAAKDSVPAWYAVLDKRPPVLGDRLLLALKKDREEQLKAVG
jgi:hypothetical protein